MKLVFPTTNAAPIDIEVNGDFIYFYQKNGDTWNEKKDGK